MPLFRKKPVVIEARKYDPDLDPTEAISVGAWCGASVWHGMAMEVPTLEGSLSASPGDWIIRGVAGEFYPCKPSIFAATYEPAGPPIPKEGTDG